MLLAIEHNPLLRERLLHEFRHYDLVARLLRRVFQETFPHECVLGALAECFEDFGMTLLIGRGKYRYRCRDPPVFLLVHAQYANNLVGFSFGGGGRVENVGDETLVHALDEHRCVWGFLIVEDGEVLGVAGVDWIVNVY